MDENEQSNRNHAYGMSRFGGVSRGTGPNDDSGFDLTNEATGETYELSNAELADLMTAQSNRARRLSDAALDRLVRRTADAVDRDLELSNRIEFGESPKPGSDADLLNRWAEEG